MYEIGALSVFVIGYILLNILEIQLSISRGLARVFFHLIHITIQISEKKILCQLGKEF